MQILIYRKWFHHFQIQRRINIIVCADNGKFNANIIRVDHFIWAIQAVKNIKYLHWYLWNFSAKKLSRTSDHAQRSRVLDGTLSIWSQMRFYITDICNESKIGAIMLSEEYPDRYHLTETAYSNFFKWIQDVIFAMLTNWNYEDHWALPKVP